MSSTSTSLSSSSAHRTRSTVACKKTARRAAAKKAAATRTKATTIKQEVDKLQQNLAAIELSKLRGIYRDYERAWIALPNDDYDGEPETKTSKACAAAYERGMQLITDELARREQEFVQTGNKLKDAMEAVLHKCEKAIDKVKDGSINKEQADHIDRQAREEMNRLKSEEDKWLAPARKAEAMERIERF